MSKHKYNHDLAQRDDFVVRFSCEANWDRFIDERSDPELTEVVKKAVKAELKKRADKEPAPAPTPVQPEATDDAKQAALAPAELATAVEFEAPAPTNEGTPTP